MAQTLSVQASDLSAMEIQTVQELINIINTDLAVLAEEEFLASIAETVNPLYYKILKHKESVVEVKLQELEKLFTNDAKNIINKLRLEQLEEDLLRMGKKVSLASLLQAALSASGANIAASIEENKIDNEKLQQLSEQITRFLANYLNCKTLFTKELDLDKKLIAVFDLQEEWRMLQQHYEHITFSPEVGKAIEHFSSISSNSDQDLALIITELANNNLQIKQLQQTLSATELELKRAQEQLMQDNIAAPLSPASQEVATIFTIEAPNVPLVKPRRPTPIPKAIILSSRNMAVSDTNLSPIASPTLSSGS